MCITSAFESFNKIGITCVRVIEAFYLQKHLFTSKHYNDLGVKHTLDNKVCLETSFINGKLTLIYLNKF